jgi:hypothetical protein
MRKSLSLLITLLALFCACKPDKADFPEEDTTKDKLQSYLPLSAGSTWRYRLESGDDVDTVIHTMAGSVKDFNKKSYHLVNAQSDSNNISEGYYYNNDHLYSLREENPYIGSDIEMVYLNDIAAVGYTWSNPITDNGMLDSIPARMVGKIIEKNINKSVLGHFYSKVIHSKIELQYNTSGTFVTTATYDFYAAKGVGIIEIKTDFGGKEVATTQLLDHQIKK